MKKKSIFLLLFCLFVACFAAYSNSLSNGFLLDDNFTILNNQYIKNFRLLPVLFTRPYLLRYYRPLTSLSFAVDHLFWGTNPIGYHLSNVLLHFINSCLLFLLLYVLFKNVALALLASIIFAIHPVHAVNINYVSDRGNLLAALFMFIGIICACRAYHLQKKNYYVWAGCAFLGSFFTRENAMLFPLYLFCASAVSYQKKFRWQFISVMAAAFLMSVFYYLSRVFLFPLSNSLYLKAASSFSLANIATFIHVIFSYIGLVFYPQDVYFLRIIEPITVFKQLMLYLVIAISGGVICYLKYRRDKIVMFALGWFFVGMMPCYMLMFSRPQMGLIMQESWMYFSSIGLFVILAAILLKLKQYNKFIFYFVLCGYSAAALYTAVVQNTYWKDAQTYCAYWLKKVPHNPYALSELANSHYLNRNYDQAIHYYKQLISMEQVQHYDKVLVPKNISLIYTQLGNIYAAKAETEEAERQFKMALGINPDDANAHFRLANLYFQQERFELAITHYEEAIKREFYHFGSHYNLALIYKKRGNAKKAFKEMKIAQTIRPEYFKNK